MTVERIIKDQAASLRHLQQHARLLQYSLDKITTVSEAARISTRFQTLVNILPKLPAAKQKRENDDAGIKLDRMVWLGGIFPLQLVFTILDDGVRVGPRTYPAVLDDSQLGRVLDQLEHILRLLAEVPPQTKLDDLPLLDSQARSKILVWNNKAMPCEPVVVENMLHQVFSARARVQPDAMAVDASDGRATYAALDELSSRLAHPLQTKMGVTLGNRVAMIFEKLLWAIVAVLGILKAGGVCVPVARHDQYDCKAALIAKNQSPTCVDLTGRVCTFGRTRTPCYGCGGRVPRKHGIARVSDNAEQSGGGL